MTTIDRDYFASLPDKEMECKPIPGMHVTRVVAYDDGSWSTSVTTVESVPTESIPAAFNGAMTKVIALMILGLCVVSFGVLMVVFGGGK